MNYLEKKLIENIKSGDDKAFEHLFTSYFGKLKVYAGEIVKNHAIAEEIVEAFFVRLWENRENLIVESSITAYVYKSVYNACLNHFKHIRVENKYRLFFYNHILIESTNDQSDQFPLNDILREELDQLVHKAIDDLPPDCKKIFLLSRFEELSHIEIAEKFKISVNTVKTQIARALNKLHFFLKENNYLIF